jgi:hypothetical protein
MYRVHATSRLRIVCLRLLARNTKIKIDINLIFSVVLYGYKTWSVVLWAENMLQGVWEHVAQKDVLAKEGGNNRSGIKLQDEKLNDLSCLSCIAPWWMRWAWPVARMGGEMRSIFRILVGKPDCKRPLVNPWRWSEDDIKMDLHEM